jgi:hypothetical protein
MVNASLLEGVYAIGQKVSNTVMQSLNLHLHPVCPRWNYTLKPRPFSPCTRSHAGHGM